MAYEISLKCKNAIVTGAGSQDSGIGNGRAAAIMLARAGAHVAVVDLDGGAASETVDMIEKEGGKCSLFVADVSNSESVAALVKSVIERLGGIDILVNNVGLAGPPGNACQVDEGSWTNAMRVNVDSVMLMSKHCIPAMEARGGGSIVNVSSIAGLGGGHPTILYPASKGAVNAMTRAMAVHHGRNNIRVNCVAPGLVLTPLVTKGGLSDEMRRARKDSNPLRLEGTGWDVGEAVLFFAGPASRWITGAILPVDGGLSMLIPMASPDSAYEAAE